MHANSVIWDQGNLVTSWEASYQCCVLRKVIRQDATAERRFEFFWTLE